MNYTPRTEKVVWEHTPHRIQYEIQAHYGNGWKRIDPDYLSRYRDQDGAVARAKHLAEHLPHRAFRVVEVEL